MDTGMSIRTVVNGNGEKFISITDLRLFILQAIIDNKVDVDGSAKETLGLLNETLVNIQKG